MAALYSLGTHDSWALRKIEYQRFYREAFFLVRCWLIWITCIYKEVYPYGKIWEKGAERSGENDA